MRREMRSSVYRGFSRLLISALTGQARLGVTIMVYSMVAVLLLAYVSAQIYADVLRQEIAQYKQTRSELREDLNKLYGDYVSLSSRSRVSQYCENRLGMKKAGGGSLEIFAVEDVDAGFSVPVELTKKQTTVTSFDRFTLRGGSERPGQ